MPEAELSDRTVLITGGAGFIGSHIADALVADNEVRVLDDLSTGRRGQVPPEATLIEGDVRDPGALARAADGVDLIFHEAGLVSVARSVEDPRTSHAVNATATVEVLERARTEDARAVVASSAAVYGHPESVPVSEDAPKTPASPYGLQKLALDHYARLYHDLYGLETVALRYFNAYGPRQSGDYAGVIDVFVEQARAGDPITVHGDGTQTRDFVFVDDVVRANLAAATTDAVGRAYNVATGDSVTIHGLAETIREVTNSASEIVHTDPRPGDVDRSRAAVGRAREELGFESQVSLEAGLERLVATRSGRGRD